MSESKHHSHAPVVCPKCGSERMRRLPRQGFWQKSIMPMLGYYPWECPLCRELSYIKRRGKRVHRSSEWVGPVMVDGRPSAHAHHTAGREERD